MPYKDIEKRKAYEKEYRQRPEVKAKKREQQRERNKKPDVIENKRLYNIAYRENNKEKIKIYNKNRREKYKNDPESRENRKKIAREYYHKPGIRERYVGMNGRAITLKQRYGITIKDKERMFEIQKGLCDICKKPFKSLWGTMECLVDHDHESGRIRGLLCNKCNLELYKDSISTMKNKIKYIEHHQILDLMDSKN